jgi:hypothetical protein
MFYNFNLEVISIIQQFLSLTFSIAKKVTKKLEKNMLLPSSLMHGPSRLIRIFQPNARLLFLLLYWLRERIVFQPTFIKSA